MAQCDKCGSPLSDAQKFCGTCGNVVAEQPAASAAAAAVTPPPLPTPPPAFTPPAYPPQGAAPQGYPPQGYQQPAYGPGVGYPTAAWQAPKKSKKGLWIGIAASVLVLAVAAILVFVVFWDQVSGKGDGGSGGSDASAQQMLAASFTATENAADVSGTYDVSVTIEAASGQDQGAMAGLGGPIAVSGTFATTQSPTAVDMTFAASLLGQKIAAGIRLVDSKPYVLFSGQWYDAPPELMQSMTSSGVTPDAAALKTLLATLAIDPSTWLKGLKQIGTEDIDGVKSVHLTGTPDVAKMITDMTALMNSPEGQSLLNAAGSASGSTDTSTSVPTAEEMATLQTQLDTLLKGSTIDLWLSKDDNSLRKIEINLQIVPPAAGASTDSTDALSSLSSAFKSLTIKASVSLAGSKPAAIVTPDSPLSSADLQSALQSDPMLGGLMGLLGGSSSLGN